MEILGSYANRCGNAQYPPEKMSHFVKCDIFCFSTHYIYGAKTKLIPVA